VKVAVVTDEYSNMQIKPFILDVSTALFITIMKKEKI